MKRFAPFVLCMSLALAGCGAVHTTTPATAPDPYTRAATVMQNFSQDLLTAQQAEITLRNSGAIDVQTHHAIENAFVFVAQRGVQVDALIASQASPASIATQLSLLTGSLGDIIASTANLSTTAAAQLKAAVAAIQLLATGVNAALNFSTVAPTPTSSTELRRWTPLKSPLLQQASSS